MSIIKLSVSIALLIIIAYQTFLFILKVIGLNTESISSSLWRGLTTPFSQAGLLNISLLTLLLMPLVFFFSTWTGKIAEKSLNHLLLSGRSIDESQRFSLITGTRYTVKIAVFLIGLSVIGVNLTSLGVLLGAFGVGIGFGLQGTVANFIAGLIIVFTHPVKEGDMVIVESIEGNVESIRLLSTVIRTLTNESIIVPNTLLINSPVHNYSFRDWEVFIRNSVSVSYDTDVEVVLNILEEIGNANPYRTTSSPAISRLASFGDSGIDLLLITRIKDVKMKYAAVDLNNREIWKRFSKEGITIPFPRRDVKIIRDSAEEWV